MDIHQIIEKYTDPEKGASYDTLYYYVPASVFLDKIIKDGNITLWAGHVDYMEDRMEFQKGMAVIRSIEELDRAYTLTIENGIKNRFPFQLSLSRARDCYPMWKIYGHGELAVMLVLDYQMIKKENPFISDCIYEDSEEYIAITNYLQGKEWLDKSGRPKTNEIENFLVQFPYLAKDKHYLFEQEVRVFRAIRKNDEKLNYRITGNLVRVFKSLVLPKEVLKGVMIGPCSDEEFELNKRAITGRLIERGFSHLHYASPLYEDSIVKSDILIRQ